MREQDAEKPESDFNAPISNLKADNSRLAAELNEVSDRAAKEAELRQLSEEKIKHLKAAAQLVEEDEQALLRRVQELAGAKEYLMRTIAKSVDECFYKLKLELNVAVASDFGQSVSVF